MVRSQKPFDTDVIASHLLDTLCHLRQATDCTELLSLMLELLENPDMGTPKRLKILSQQCEAMWWNLNDEISVSMKRVADLCDPPVSNTTAKPKTGSSVLEP